VYILSGWVNTTVCEGGPRGDTRVRLISDPAGGNDFDGDNTSQWYWTDGDWIRFQHEFTATGDKAVVGFGFFRWRDLDMAAAHVDNVTVFDLGPSPAAFDAPPVRTEDVSNLVLVDEQEITDGKSIEGYLEAPAGYVVTGLGARAHYDNITTMWMQIRPLLADGTLGEPEELRTGNEPDSHLEAQVILPDGYVATGFGAGIKPEWDVNRFIVWARPLNADGTLGEEKDFRAGRNPESGPEQKIEPVEGRILIGAGLNCMLNDVNRVHGKTAKLILTPTGAMRGK
jgi:hypothetical protein